MNSELRLALLSFTALFLELALIRWMPAHAFSIGFFSNVVLIGSFLGLGTGFLLTGSSRNLERFFPALFTFTIVSTLMLGSIRVAVPPNAQTWLWSFYEGNRIGRFLAFELSITQILALVYVIATLVFIPLGQRIGRQMRELDPLRGYTWNVAGSLAGVVAFAILSVLGAPAFVWFASIVCVYLIVVWHDNRALVGALVMLAAVGVVASVESSTVWSPYYAINTQVSSENNDLYIFVNQLFHQKAVDFNKEPSAYEKFSIPYRLFRPETVLVVGAGNGNDVAVALRNGANRIDAVEIDPAIQRIGLEHHPQRPYADRRVRTHINDARSFMHSSTERYDMIVYGTLDSHASFSVASSMRLDNYVYTLEALNETKRLLSDRGVVVLLYSVPNQWMFNRLLSTARVVFGDDNSWCSVYDDALFNLMVVAGPGVAAIAETDPLFRKEFRPVPRIAGAIVPTDDWPYLYLEKKAIPDLYRNVIAILISLSLVTILAVSPVRHKGIDPLFFFLGCGFLLLEAKSVTTFSLLFGSTWQVNAVVFGAILSIATVANMLMLRKKSLNPYLLFSGLLASIFILYFLPVAPLLHLQWWVKCTVAGAVVALPIFFSSMIFARSISNTGNVGLAMGSNLMGAVIGGFSEYFSMIFGLNALYLLAFLFYLAALLCFRRVPG